MNDVGAAEATNLQYDDENIDDIKELDSRKYTVLENSQENKSSEGIDDVGSKGQENKTVFAVNSTVPSPARPHTNPEALTKTLRNRYSQKTLINRRQHLWAMTMNGPCEPWK